MQSNKALVFWLMALCGRQLLLAPAERPGWDPNLSQLVALRGPLEGVPGGPTVLGEDQPWRLGPLRGTQPEALQGEPRAVAGANVGAGGGKE